MSVWYTRQKLLNANLLIIVNWLRQTGFFLDHEGTFCNQGKSYAFPPKLLFHFMSLSFRVKMKQSIAFTGKVVVLLV